MPTKKERIVFFCMGIAGVIILCFWGMFVITFIFGGLWKPILAGPQVGFLVALGIIFIGGVIGFLLALGLIAAFAPSNKEK